jgi:hypothetical protein
MPSPAGLLTESQLADFTRDGFILVRGLLDGSWLRSLQPDIRAAFDRNRPAPEDESGPMTAYQEAFVQVVNMGMGEPHVRSLSRSSLLGQAAAELMKARGARIFVEDAMFKEDGRGHTPWHQDGSTLPMEPRQMVTAWIPLLPIGPESGRLRVVRGSHHLGLIGPVDISEATDKAFAELIDAQGLEVVTLPPMEPGDVSFHDGATIHGALPNNSGRLREVMALHYFADGARISALDNPSQISLMKHLAPDLRPGDLARSPVWPLVFNDGNTSEAAP